MATFGRNTETRVRLAFSAPRLIARLRFVSGRPRPPLPDVVALLRGRRPFLRRLHQPPAARDLHPPPQWQRAHRQSHLRGVHPRTPPLLSPASPAAVHFSSHCRLLRPPPQDYGPLQLCKINSKGNVRKTRCGRRGRLRPIHCSVLCTWYCCLVD